MYAVCQDMRGATAEDYAKVKAELGGADETAAGLVAHVAGPVEGGYRIIDTWESHAAAQAFWTDHLEPAVARAHGDRGAAAARAVPVARGRRVSRQRSRRRTTSASWPSPTQPEADPGPGAQGRPRVAQCRAAGQERRGHDDAGRPLPHRDDADLAPCRPRPRGPAGTPAAASALPRPRTDQPGRAGRAAARRGRRRSPTRSATASSTGPHAVARPVSTATAPSTLSSSPASTTTAAATSSHQPPAGRSGQRGGGDQQRRAAVTSVGRHARRRRHGRATAYAAGEPAADQHVAARVVAAVQPLPPVEVHRDVRLQRFRSGARSGAVARPRLLVDLAGRRRRVEGDEVQPGHALGEQPRAQLGGHLDADLAHGVRVVLDRVQPLGQVRRERRVRTAARTARSAGRWSTGMMPGMIGTSQPAAATRSRSRR